MSNYVAPVREMMFAMNELAGLEEICGLPGNEEVSGDLVEAILDEAGKIRDRSSRTDQPVRRSSGQQVGRRRGDDCRRLQGGLFVLLRNRLERHAGLDRVRGQGLPVTVSTAVLEMWKSANMSFRCARC